MATTFTLKRKYFADQQGEQKKGISTGKKLAIAGGVAATAATALAAHGAGGFRPLAGNISQSFKNAGGGLKGVGGAFKGVGTNIGEGAKKLPGDAKNIAGKVLKSNAQ